MGYYYFLLCPIIFRQQESVLDFSKKMIHATQETVSNVLLQVPNALKIVFLNREDGDQVTVLQQRISLNGVENASIAQSFLLLRLNFFPMMLLPIIFTQTKWCQMVLKFQMVSYIYLITVLVMLKLSLRIFCRKR